MQETLKGNPYVYADNDAVNLVDPSGAICVHISNTVLEITAWATIISGAIVSILGLFAAGTVIGLPIGAVLGAVGIGIGLIGSFELWYVDKYLSNGYEYCI